MSEPNYQTTFTQREASYLQSAKEARARLLVVEDQLAKAVAGLKAVDLILTRAGEQPKLTARGVVRGILAELGVQDAS